MGAWAGSVKGPRQIGAPDRPVRATRGRAREPRGSAMAVYRPRRRTGPALCLTLFIDLDAVAQNEMPVQLHGPAAEGARLPVRLRNASANIGEPGAFWGPCLDIVDHMKIIRGVQRKCPNKVKVLKSIEINMIVHGKNLSARLSGRDYWMSRML